MQASSKSSNKVTMMALLLLSNGKCQKFKGIQYKYKVAVAPAFQWMMEDEELQSSF